MDIFPAEQKHNYHTIGKYLILICLFFSFLHKEA